MITLKQARALQRGDRISYTPTPLPGDPQGTQLGTVTAVLPAFNLPYRTVPARVFITWEPARVFITTWNITGQASITLDPGSQAFWDCISILD